MELSLKKDPLEDITYLGFHARTTRKYCCVLSQNKYIFSEVFDRPVFAEKLSVWETRKGKNSRIRLDGKGKPR